MTTDYVSNYKYLGDYSATPTWFSRTMYCNDCMVSWLGCWDNFHCPKCGEGELPSNEIICSKNPISSLKQNLRSLNKLHSKLKTMLTELEELVND